MFIKIVTGVHRKPKKNDRGRETWVGLFVLRLADFQVREKRGGRGAEGG